VSAPELERVKERITSAFADVPHPEDGEIACECKSALCEGLAMEAEFKPFNWQKVPGEVIDKFAQSLPIFTAEGYRYFLPAYMMRALDTADSEVWEAVILGLPGSGGAAEFLPPVENEVAEPSLSMFHKVAQLLEEHEEERLNDFNALQIEAMIEFVEYLVANPTSRTEDFIEDLFTKAESLDAYLGQQNLRPQNLN
jgi:hypothetical protein